MEKNSSGICSRNSPFTFRLQFRQRQCAASTAAAGSEAAGSEAAKPAEVTTVKVGVVGEYNAQWDTINELLKDDGIQVELLKFTDYAAPNRALNDGEIDLNAFQHKAFLF